MGIWTVQKAFVEGGAQESLVWGGDVLDQLVLLGVGVLQFMRLVADDTVKPTGEVGGIGLDLTTDLVEVGGVVAFLFVAIVCGDIRLGSGFARRDLVFFIGVQGLPLGGWNMRSGLWCARFLRCPQQYQSLTVLSLDP